MGEDEEPEARVGIQLVETGLPGDEDGTRADFLQPGVGDGELIEPAEQLGGLLLVDDEVSGQGEALLPDVAGGLMQRQGQALHQIGQHTGLIGIVGGFAALFVGELEEELRGGVRTEHVEVEGLDVVGPAMQAGGDEDMAGGEALQQAGERGGGLDGIDIIDDEQPVAMAGQPVHGGGDARGFVRRQSAPGVQMQHAAERGEAGVEFFRRVATDEQQRGVVSAMPVRILDGGMRLPNAPEPRDPRGGRRLRDGGGVGLLLERIAKLIEECIASEEESADVAAGEIAWIERPLIILDPKVIIQDVQSRLKAALIRQLGHLLQEIGQVPALDDGTVGWLLELFGCRGFICEQEEDDELVEVLMKPVFDRLFRCLGDLAGIVLIGDLKSDAACFVPEVCCGIVGVLSIEVDQVPVHEGVEEPRHDRLQPVVGIVEAGAGASLQLIGEHVQPVADRGGDVLMWKRHGGGSTGRKDDATGRNDATAARTAAAGKIPGHEGGKRGV